MCQKTGKLLKFDTKKTLNRKHKAKDFKEQSKYSRLLVFHQVHARKKKKKVKYWSRISKDSIQKTICQ
jgi:hypothetical protein